MNVRESDNIISLINDIGIDKIGLYNIPITQIDTNKLISMNAGTITTDNSKALPFFDISKSNKKLKRIEIKKNINNSIPFSQLVIDFKTQNRALESSYYTSLYITMPRVLNYTNKTNISKTEEVIKIFKTVEDSLNELGFGKVDLFKSNIKMLEINKNIRLKDRFLNYETVIEYIKNTFNTAFHNKKNVPVSYKGQNIYTGTKLSHKSRIFKIYDKREDIKSKYKFDIGYELLRIEYTLSNSSVIKNYLGTTEVNKLLNNDLKTVKRAFKTMIEKDSFKRIDKDIDRQLKHCIKHLNSYKRTSGTFTINYLNENKVIDIQVILGALRKTEPRYNYPRAVKTLIERTKESKNKKYTGNINKLNEIKESLGLEPIKFDLTRNTINLLKVSNL